MSAVLNHTAALELYCASYGICIALAIWITDAPRTSNPLDHCPVRIPSLADFFCCI